MNRRKLITLLGGAAATWPLAVRAQQRERMRRIGIVMPFDKVRRVRRIDENEDYYRKLSNQWAEALRAAVASMDEYKD